MLSLAELRHAAVALSALKGWKVQRIVQTDDANVYFTLYGFDEGKADGVKRHLRLCCKGELAHVGELDDLPKAPVNPPSFCNLLRAKLDRARLAGAEVKHDDRLLSLRFKTKDDEFELVLSIMGSRSNLYLLDGGAMVRGAIRSLDDTRRELQIGKPWMNPDSPPPEEGMDRWGEADDGELLREIGDTYRRLECESETNELKRRIESVLRRSSEFLEHKIAKLDKELHDAEDARALKKEGELLKSVMHKIQPGDTEVIAEDFETGAELHIPLNPALSAAENLKAFFKKYHKGLTGANMLGQQIEVVRSTLSDVHKLLSEFEQLNASGFLDAAMIREFAQRGAIKSMLQKYYPESRRITKPPKSKPKKKEVPGKLKPRRYATAEGLEVWVGKSDEGNDYLTTKLADGTDLFFHLEGWPGSHVVLRLKGRKDPPPDALLDACELAVYYSKQKGASRANVHVAAIKDVKKPSGAKPGLVYVNRGKTIALRHEPKRLERVLGAVIKEEGK